MQTIDDGFLRWMCWYLILVVLSTFTRSNLKCVAVPISDEAESEAVEPNDLFEGDILFFPQTDSDSSARGTTDTDITNILAKTELSPQLWTDGHVPFQLSKLFTSTQKAAVLDAMANLQDNTCVLFRPRTTETDYLFIGSGVTCSSPVGRVGKRQNLILSTECSMSRGQVLHELMHVLGFFHEQSRPDRDEYINIIWDNVIGGQKNKNFLKYPSNPALVDLYDYDFASVLHYPKDAFAIRPNTDTIESKIPLKENIEIGQRRSCSPIDLKKINQLHKCPQASLPVCGYLYENEKFDGIMTVIYDGKHVDYSAHVRKYRSGKVLDKCLINLYTEEENENSLTLVTGWFESFDQRYQTRVTRLMCGCESSHLVTTTVPSRALRAKQFWERVKQKGKSVLTTILNDFE